MRIAVCDECPETQRDTVDLLRQYCLQKSLSHNIIPYQNGASLMYDIDDGYVFDILFLSISQGINCGISLARRLRNAAYKGAIVFLSPTAEFAYDSYEVNASGYLLNPTTMDKIHSVMSHIRMEMDRDVYLIYKRGQAIRIPYEEIIYIESDNSRCTLHRIGGNTYTVYKSLTAIQKELDDSRFLRCHQSFLINMHHVKEAQSYFEMINGDKVMIRQRQLKQVRESYLEYISVFDHT